MEEVLPATLSAARGNKEIYTEIIKDSRNVEVYSMLVLLPKGQGKFGDFCPYWIYLRSHRMQMEKLDKIIILHGITE